MSPLPFILFIVLVVIKASSKKQKAGEKKKRIMDEVLEAIDEANVKLSNTAPKRKAASNAAAAAMPGSDGAYGEYGEYSGYAAGFEQPGGMEKPQPSARRRRAVPARPVETSRNAPKGEGYGGGSIQGFVSSEGECSHGDDAHSSRLTHRIESAYESSFAPVSGDDAYASGRSAKPVSKPSLVFAENPVVNGIIWNEVLKRPNARRR